MKKAIPKAIGGKRPGAGRPATGRDPARTFRLSDRFMANVDAWAAGQEDEPGRSEAIRRLVELGLTVNTKARPSDRLRAVRAAQLAVQAIDTLTIDTADTDEQAGRRRRLLKGPEEFREMRIDRPKVKKTPGEVEPQKPISKAEREARKAFRQVDAATAMTEHEIAQKAFSKNRERLKAERLEREAATPPPAKTRPKAKGK